MPLSLSEQLTYSTIRIECTLANGALSIGTGFFFMFHPDGLGVGSRVPTIVTNKHVVRNAFSGRLVFSKLDSDNISLQNDFYEFRLPANFEEQWIMHPEQEVDLCCLPIASIYSQARQEGIHLVTFNFNTSITIAPPFQLVELDAIEEIIMIGYPEGLWDNINNKPIIRRGITATHPGVDYQGKKEFLIDAACFHGSSGSPVLILNRGFEYVKAGATIGRELTLLGVLYAGPELTIEGEIQIAGIPTEPDTVVTSVTMMNLGVVIKAERIMELQTLVLTRQNITL